MNHPLKNIPLEDIDLDDAAFRLSYGPDLGPLKQSIGRVGLINPPVVRRRTDARYQIICGYRRVCALREIGVSSAVCKLVTPGTADEACLLLNLYDNTSHREFNPIEKSMAINRFLNHFPEDRVVSDFLPLLKLKPHITQLQAFQPLCRLEKELQDALLEGIIDVHTALRLAQLDPEIRTCLARLLIVLRLSVSKQSEVMSSILEIACRENVSPTVVVDDTAVRFILEHARLNQPQKGDAVLRHLREKRYPHLTAKEKQVKGVLKKVKLPQGISITPPPFFEDNRYCLSVYFTGWNELKERLDLLDPLLADDLLTLE